MTLTLALRDPVLQATPDILFPYQHGDQLSLLLTPSKISTEYACCPLAHYLIDASIKKCRGAGGQVLFRLLGAGSHSHIASIDG